MAKKKKNSKSCKDADLLQFYDTASQSSGLSADLGYGWPTGRPKLSTDSAKLAIDGPERVRVLNVKGWDLSVNTDFSKAIFYINKTAKQTAEAFFEATRYAGHDNDLVFRHKLFSCKLHRPVACDLRSELISFYFLNKPLPGIDT